MRFWRPVLVIFWICFVIFTVLVTWLRDQQTDPYWIAYVKEVEGNMDIYVRPAGGGKSWRLTDHPDADFMPIWSPDGQWIAFETYREREGSLIDPTMFLMRPNGGGLQLLGNVRGFLNVRQAFWSPHSTHFFYYRETAGHSLWQWNHIDEQLPHSMFPQRLGEWSPDGAKLIEIYWDPEGEQLFWQNYQTSERSDLLAQFTFIASPRWSHDGEWIVFSAGDSRDQFDIYRASADGTQLQNLTSSSANEEAPLWSPDGRWIYFMRSIGENTRQVFRMHPDASGLEQVTHFTGFSYIHEWSPKGEWAAILNSPDNRRIRSLYLMAADGNTIELIHENIRTPSSRNGTSWSQTGDAIVYGVEDRCEIYHINSKSRQTASTCGLWSPDGKWFIRYGGANESSIVQTNIHTGEQQTLSPMHWSIYPNTYAHCWSPKRNAFNTLDQRGNSPIPLISIVIGVPIFVLFSIWRQRSN